MITRSQERPQGVHPVVSAYALAVQQDLLPPWKLTYLRFRQLARRRGGVLCECRFLRQPLRRNAGNKAVKDVHGPTSRR